MSPLLNYTLSAHENLHVASSVCEGDVVMRSVCETAEKRLYMSMPQAACAGRFWWVSSRTILGMARTRTKGGGLTMIYVNMHLGTYPTVRLCTEISWGLRFFM
jgi:hypothetical protein